MAAKAITIATSLVSVPLTLHYLGAERYGIWMVISSFTIILSFADMGLGNGVLNAISKCHGRQDRPGMKTVISSGYLILLLVCASIIALFSISYSWISWGGLFNAKSDIAVREAGPSVAVFLVCFAVTVPASLIQKVQLGLQEGFRSSLWQCAGSVFGLVGVLVAIYVKAGLPWLVAALVGGPLIASLANSVSFFSGSNSDIRPSLSSISKIVAMKTLQLGFLFFILQIVVSAAYGADSLIIARTLGASAVAAYAVPERMFAIIAMVLAMALTPLWPAYGEAIERGDHTWVSRALRRAVLISAASSTVLAVALIIFGPLLLSLWVGPTFHVSMVLLVGLAVWRIIESLTSALTVYMNGAGMLFEQIGIATVCGVVMLALKVLLVHKIGIAGIPFGAALAFLPLATLPSFWLVHRRFRRGP